MEYKKRIKDLVNKDKGKVDDKLSDIGMFLFDRFIYYKAQSHLWHFQTTVESTHSTLQMFYEKLEDILDTFIEMYQGKFGRIRGDVSIKVCSLKSETGITTILDELETDTKKMLKHPQISGYPEFEFQAVKLLKLVSKTSYLLTLK